MRQKIAVASEFSKPHMFKDEAYLIPSQTLYKFNFHAVVVKIDVRFS
jgi:hypothetical protein